MTRDILTAAFEAACLCAAFVGLTFVLFALS